MLRDPEPFLVILDQPDYTVQCSGLSVQHCSDTVVNEIIRSEPMVLGEPCDAVDKFLVH